ncbi:hypothetical protein CO641_02360 [Lysobacteraceae bacterium NML91-0213]|nr:hypothetical protein CO641_02360 [Xanthomonadaceae bacterium NML91-0213]
MTGTAIAGIGWHAAPADVRDRWHLQRSLPNGELEVALTPAGDIRLFPSEERGNVAATYLNDVELEEFQ